jgi:membrane-bound lytic murein transglycosylase F
MPVTDARAREVRFSHRVHTVDAQLVSMVLDPSLVGDADLGKETAYATRKENAVLADALDAFLKKSDRGLEWNVLKKSYFTPREPSAPADIAQPANGGGGISPYDALIHKHASVYGFDWRLMLAQAYQESRFDPKARSWVGAQGLFQVMPATGKEMGYTHLEEPDEGVLAGVRYMAKLVDSFDPKIPFKHRVRFALASYNAGRGHVEDARVLAKEMGLDPNKWFKNVETAMLRLQDPRVARRARHGWCRAEEPVKYVSEIQSRYDNYLTLLPDVPAPEMKK